MGSLQLESKYGTIDLDELAKTGRGIQVTAGLTGFGLPPVQTRWIEGAGDGARYRGTRVLPRDIDISLTLVGDDRNDLQGLFGRLAKVLSGEVILRQIEDDGSSWWIACRHVGGGDYAYGVNTYAEREADIIITLRAGDPFWKAGTQESTLASVEITVENPTNVVPITNSGDSDAPPTWTINGPGGPFTAVSPDGDVLKWGGTLTAEETLTIDTEKGTVRDQRNDNRYADLDKVPRMWMLPPGISMVSVSLENADPAISSVHVSWYARRWSIA